MTIVRYSLPAPLVQDLVRVLEALPAGQTRHMLNAIEAECIAQDTQRSQPHRRRRPEPVQPPAHD